MKSLFFNREEGCGENTRKIMGEYETTSFDTKAGLGFSETLTSPGENWVQEGRSG